MDTEEEQWWYPSEQFESILAIIEEERKAVMGLPKRPMNMKEEDYNKCALQAIANALEPEHPGALIMDALLAREQMEGKINVEHAMAAIGHLNEKVAEINEEICPVTLLLSVAASFAWNEGTALHEATNTVRNVFSECSRRRRNGE